jgi:Protein of unknown function (DUF3455)
MKTLTLAAALSLPLSIAVPAFAAADHVTPPPVPSDLNVPAGKKAFLIGHAHGTQNYSCLPSATGVAWTLFGPQATLFSEDGDQLITHFLSPNPEESGTPRATWQHSKDSSSVWAVATAIYTQPDYVAPGAIPWLKLQVVGRQFGPQWGDRLLSATHIQRVNTAGGIAPSTGCAVAADIGKKALVPYETDYVFYR